jgi:hypothetical protein
VARKGVVAHNRLQRLAVPRLADDRRQRVAFACQHFEHLRELRLDDEPALVSAGRRIFAGGRVADLGDQALPARQAADQAVREGLIDVSEQPPDVTPG